MAEGRNEPVPGQDRKVLAGVDRRGVAREGPVDPQLEHLLLRQVVRLGGKVAPNEVQEGRPDELEGTECGRARIGGVVAAA